MVLTRLSQARLRGSCRNFVKKPATANDFAAFELEEKWLAPLQDFEAELGGRLPEVQSAEVRGQTVRGQTSQLRTHPLSQVVLTDLCR